ncbi:MAG: hypothetical protein FJX51_12530, partial [Alphaproteobacteria bacterium]|nr:hypothetical protein [Alphaproteobacteria bacterium]
MVAEPGFRLEDLDPESRALAEAAAAREGVSVQAWLNRLVLARSAAAPKPTAPRPAPIPQVKVPPPRPTLTP